MRYEQPETFVRAVVCDRKLGTNAIFSVSSKDIKSLQPLQRETMEY